MPWRRALDGAVVGAILMTQIAYLFWDIYEPTVFRDPRAAMINVTTGAFGAALGAVAGTAWALASGGNRIAAGSVCLGGGGIIAGLSWLFTLMLWCAAAPGEHRIAAWLFALIFPGYGAPFVWAVAEMGWGIRLRQRR